MKFLHNDPKLKKKRRELRRNQTDAEKALWARLRNKQFYDVKFFRQYSMGPYILDFYSPLLKTAIELDGGQHSEEEQCRHDTLRTNYLQTQGITVLRFWNNDVIANMQGVLDEMCAKFNPSRPPL
ncbi:MAG: endonuclease domain-containing protein [Deltaproteobacteria bacterium]|nr:endonuclease domain-containing protein [Deltaproteobacteria bacterium]